MARLEAAGAVLSTVVPPAKALGWIVVTGVTVFWAGVGSALSWGEYSDLPAVVATQARTDLEQAAAIDSLRLEVRNGQDERDRILCLVTLTATGETLNPLEVQDRCP